MRPLIFLDFDGVIVIPPNWKEANPDCIDRLNKITDATGAEIVISSSWRSHTNPTAEEDLRKWGVTAPLIGRTPRLESRLPNSAIYIARTRGEEIMRWLLDHPGEYEKILIIDDSRDMGPLLPHLLLTEFETGLTDSHVQEAIRRLS